MSTAERRKREIENRKKMILGATEKLIMSQELDSITMNAVAEKAQLAKGTVYLYFKDKDQLLAALSVKGLNILLKKFERAAAEGTSTKDKLVGMLRQNYKYFQKYPAYYKLNAEFESKYSASALKELEPISVKIYALFNSVIDEGFSKGEINAKLDGKYLANIMWGTTVGVMQFLRIHSLQFNRSTGLKKEEMFENFLESLINGMTSN
ncbi:MAG: TetR/AcrR family transcriptional regulator [Bacteroidota bacterium]